MGRILNNVRINADIEYKDACRVSQNNSIL